MDTTAQPSAPVASTAIPTVDLKAPLKIEEEHTDDAPKVDYGDKLFVGGIIFCILIVITVSGLAFFWTQMSNQTQEVVTIEQSK